MQKKLYKISITCLSLFAILLVIRVINLIQNKNELIENSYSNDYVIDKKDNLSMMLETDYDSNEYELATSSEWPTDGYIFNAELSACKNGSKVSWDSNTNRVMVYAGSIDSCYIYFDKEPDTIYLADYITNTVYTGIDGENGLYYHDGVGSYTNASEEAGDNSYRYSGTNPNNYVCFGSDEATCPANNLYRVIGVFGEQVKLIKHDYTTADQLGINGDYHNTYVGANINSSFYKGTMDISTITSYYWNGRNTNEWSESGLNTVNLNTNYINYLNEINTKWINMIEDKEWLIGGNLYNLIMNTSVKNTFINEIVNPYSTVMYNAKIGLMYVSDYGYAANPIAWTLTMAEYGNTLATSNNWMYMGLSEWIISHQYGVTTTTFGLNYEGYAGEGPVYNNSGAIRPTFYLKSNVAITDGDGSSSSPYRIALD